MKKLKLFLFATSSLLILSVSTTEAKKGDIFAVGDNNLNIQLGFLNTWYYGSYYGTSLPQFSVSFDHGLRDDWGPGIFGVGAFVSAATYKYTRYVDDYRVNEFNVAGRATYHYQFFDKVDTYGGVIAGINIRTDNIDSDEDDSINGVYPMGSLLAGIKYYFSNNLSVMSEVYIYDVALINIGIGLKF